MDVQMKKKQFLLLLFLFDWIHTDNASVKYGVAFVRLTVCLLE